MLKIGTWKQSFKMSIQNILGNKMRSFLTMLGIIIGVTAVISLITVVSGVTDYLLSQFSSLGAGSLTVTANGTALKSGLTENDLSEIESLDNVEGISPSVSVSTNVVRNSYVSSDVTVSGKNEQYFVRNDVVTLGRALNISDMGGDVKVCVIDDACAQTFFTGENPIGKTIMIGGIQYTVVGMCGEDESLMTSMSGGSGGDGTIYIPWKNALTMNGKNSVTSLEVYVADTTRTDELVESLEALLANTFNNVDGAYSVVNMDSLVSVTERTKEIGLRKALGAEPGIIQLQFLMESIILSVIGGIVGIGLGELISYAAALLLGTEFSINIGAVALGFGFSLGVGVIFGWAPARNASRLNPIDALRTE